jgi:hypothetical protein
MNFNALFQAQIDTLKSEGNYRYFAELERKCGKFPHAGQSPRWQGARRDGLVLQ